MNAAKILKTAKEITTATVVSKSEAFRAAHELKYFVQHYKEDNDRVPAFAGHSASELESLLTTLETLAQ
jgi:hypothetical protein